MSRNGSGTFNPDNTFAPGDPWTADVVNAMYNDLGDELSNSIAKDGQTAATGPIKFASGTAAAPSITFSVDTDSGFYRIGPNDIGISLNGAFVYDFSTTGLTTTGFVSAVGYVNTTDEFKIDGLTVINPSRISTCIGTATRQGTGTAGTAANSYNFDWTAGSAFNAYIDTTLVGTVAFLASPAFTGVPTAPTAAGGTNTTQLATTAFAKAEATSAAAAAQAAAIAAASPFARGFITALSTTPVVNGGTNIASVSRAAAGRYVCFFTSAAANTNYTVALCIRTTSGQSHIVYETPTRTTGWFEFAVYQALTGHVDAEAVSIIVYP